GSLLNRYWDDRAEPRPESYRPDYELAQTVPEGQRDALYRNLRATAESGWDFSSRWMRDPKDLRTLETTQLVPVDLNSLLYHAEVTIAALRRVRGRPGDREVAERFARAAQDRRRALLAAAYDPATGYFYDVRWQTGARVAARPEPAHLPGDGQDDREVRRGRLAAAGGWGRVSHAGWVRMDERGGAGAGGDHSPSVNAEVGTRNAERARMFRVATSAFRVQN